VSLLGLVCLMGVSLASPVAARADGLPGVDLSGDPWFVNWTALLPPAYLGVDTSSSDICVAGKIKCVDRVAQRLERQLSSLGCNHNAVFSLAYARTTEKIAQVERADPSFFADTPWLNHYDAVFADMYFTAWNAWQNRKPGVPDAWAMAFDAADRKKVSGGGNLLLGMSAHVNRDLPFTLYAIGLVAPDGTSRKPDHDKVNEVLNMVVTPLIDEVAAKYDPSARVVPGLGGLGDYLEFQALPAWREQAWRNAERLATAPDAAARAVIAADIERSAATEASLLIALTQYQPPVTTSAPRDAFCAAHVG
jgi:Family of unknown function (DUF5995)